MILYPFRSQQQCFEQFRTRLLYWLDTRKQTHRRTILQQVSNQLQGEAAVCSAVVYCDCPLHQTISILFVRCEFNGKISKYVLPGGKRDIAGQEGRVRHSKQHETCWQAMKGEFAEEVNENITNHCPLPCPYINIQVQRSETVSYCVRLYYFQAKCESMPSMEYGRLRFHEAIERKWIPLEDVVQQFKEQYKSDKQKMTLSSSMFVTFRQFANILANQLRLRSVSDSQQQVRVFKTIKLLELLQKTPGQTSTPAQIPLIPRQGHSQFVLYQ